MISFRIPPILFVSIFLLLTPLFIHAQQKKHGRNVLHDSTGVYAVGRTKNYKREGNWRDMYPNGTIRREGKYHNGLPEGRHTSYWPNEARKEIAEYTNGQPNGIYVSFDQNGDTIKCCHYSAGELYGAFYERDTATLAWTRGYLLAGKRTGTWEIGNVDSLLTCEYVDDKKNGAFHLDQRGYYITQGFYKNDVPDSVWTRDVYGELSREYWLVNGKKYKTDKTFFYQTDSVYCETRYRSPDEPSMFIVYHRNGTPAKTEWYTGVFVDSVVHFFSDGKVLSKSIYAKNRITGASPLQMCCAWNASGTELLRKYCYSDGSDSVRFDYNSNGVLVRKTMYDHGSLRNSYYYYDNGKLKLQIGSDIILAYTPNGKRMRTGSKEYTQLFLQLDSLDEQYASIQLFSDPHAPESPVSISGPKDTTDVTYIGYDEPYSRYSNGLVVLEPDPPIVFAEVMPEFPGYIGSYFTQNLRYPEREREMQIEGTVYVRFVVERDGSVTGVQVVKEVLGGPGLSAEAVRVVTSMPKWKPATQNGMPVRCIMTVPIKFALK